MSVWSDVLIGIAVVAGSILLVKNVYMWNIYRRSIQTEIYSNFPEYQLRRKSLTKLSESYYLNSVFGKHRIVYQMAQAKNEKAPQAYVILILASGLYILNVKNQSGRVLAKRKGDFKQYFKDRGKEEKLFLFRNPLDEVRFFEKRLKEKLPSAECPVTNMVVFPQRCQLSWDGQEDGEIRVLRRKQLFGVIKEHFEKNPAVLTEGQIDDIFHALADEAIKLEKANQ